MPKDKPELYAIGEKVRVKCDDGYAEGEIVATYRHTFLGSVTVDNPSRVSKLPPWEPKHGEQVYVGLKGDSITRVGTYIARGPQKGSVIVGFSWVYDHIVRPITDDYASVGKPWKDEE